MSAVVAEMRNTTVLQRQLQNEIEAEMEEEIEIREERGSQN